MARSVPGRGALVVGSAGLEGRGIAATPFGGLHRLPTW